MDEPKIDYPRTIAGCIAITAILAAGILLGRCSAPAAAQSQKPQTPLTLDQAITIGNNETATAEAAIAETLTALTTTTTVPQYRNTPPAVSTDERWDQLAQCETGGNWAANTANGYGGGLQFAHTATVPTATESSTLAASALAAAFAATIPATSLSARLPVHQYVRRQSSVCLGWLLR